MNEREQISTYYSNARLLIKQGNPKAARYYVLKILNKGLDIYNKATNILLKAKTKVFLEKWVAVSRDLYGFGITDYVLECFGLLQSQNKTDNKPVQKKLPKERGQLTNPEQPISPPDNDGGIDMSGLIDETAQIQGWTEKVFTENKNATVEISCSAAGCLANGTGFIISDNGYLLTNDHVVFDEQRGVYYSKLNMSLVGEQKKYKIEVLFSDKKADVALCRFNPSEVQGFKSVKMIADYDKVNQGAECLIIGNAFGMGLAPLTGHIRFVKNKTGNLVHDAPSNPGDSGGPVFNRLGECIGINKSKTLSFNGTAADGYANATPMETIRKLLKKWTENNNIVL